MKGRRLTGRIVLLFIIEAVFLTPIPYSLTPIPCFSKLFPGLRVQSDDGFREFPSNQRETEARLQAQEKQNDESVLV
jgi:hypothetical protein